MKSVRSSLRNAAPAALLFATACGGNFDPSSRVDSLRVLAVRADLPYAHPGDTVAIDALGVDPDGRAISWGFATCENPKDASALGCLEALRERRARGEDVRLEVGTSEQYSVSVSEEALRGAPAGNAVVGVVAVACPGVLEPAIAGSTTIVDPLPVVCRDANTGKRLGPFDFIAGMKRVFVREEDRNENPVAARILFDGKPWDEADVPVVTACDAESNDVTDCAEALRHRVSVEATRESFEKGTDENGVSFEEQLVVQYYATEGTFEDDVRIAADPETQWVARRSARGSTVRFWLVLRDSRGGVTWAERTVEVAR